MTQPSVEIAFQHQVAAIVLNRPAVRNAFDAATVHDITRAFRELGVDDKVRAIVLAARGPAFCAGADLNWMKQIAGYTREQNRADAAQLAEMLRTIHHCPKPVIARVQGDCYGGGVGLVAVCDIVVAAEDAHFCLSEVKLGLIAATISPYVINAMGQHAARRYMLTAERFSAQEARRIGFVHEVVKSEALDFAVDKITGALLSAGPNALRETKRLIRDVAGKSLDDALIAETAERIASIRTSPEGREGMRAFLEKRKPGWLVGE